VDQRVFFRNVSELIKRSRHDEALTSLRQALSQSQLDAEGVEKAGQLCTTCFKANGTRIAARVLLLGQCTTTWLSHALVAEAWADGRALAITEGAYDNVLQELLSATTTDTAVDVVVLLPWHQRLLSADVVRTAAERIDAERAFWEQGWRLVEKRLSARLVQVGYDWTSPGPLGYMLGGRTDGNVALVRAVNASLRTALPKGAAFVDLEQISGEIGRGRFYDPRRYFWTKQPFSEEGAARLAEHLAAGIRALLSGPKKVLVLDLDNTLWGGVVGETGPLGVKLGDGPDGEAFVAFQRYVKQLSDRGIVLTVASKNNDPDAREPFEKNSNMVLSLADFAQFEANWEPKAASIRRMASALQLGLESFVFFDDNPAEREHIRQALPEVAVVEVPDDPAEYVRALDDELWFEIVDLTSEDRMRAAQYRSEHLRREAAGAAESLDGYLTSLDMVAEVRPIDEPDMDRVVQLLGKTNQFNLTTRRHGLARVRQFLDNPKNIGLTLRLTDRFGDHGLVSVVIALMDDEGAAITIDTWLMSCRVINRTVEEFLFNQILEDARRRGVRRLDAEYLPTAKNELVKDLYDRLGFTRSRETPERVEYCLDVQQAPPATTFVRLLNPSG
jgi:FkbH-like protein